MQYNDLMSEVRERAALADRSAIDLAIGVTLETLGERLAGAEPSDLAAQLPSEVKHSVGQHDGPGEQYDTDEFLRRVAQRLDSECSPEDARIQSRAVLSAVADSVSIDEIDDVRTQLPAGFAPLLN